MPVSTAGAVEVDGIPLLLVPGTYQKGESSLWARGPLRQGMPVTLGPASTWKQEDFSGGVGRSRWEDEKMYFIGNADTRAGTVKCGYVLQRTAAGLLADNSHKVVALRPRNENENTRMYYASVGSRDLWEATLMASSSKIWTTPSAGHVITSLGRGFAESSFGLHIGLQNGTLWYIPTSSSTVGAKTTGDHAGAIVFVEAALAKGDVSAAIRKLYKWDADGNKWVLVGFVDMDIIDGEFWNQQWYFLATDGKTRSTLFTTDLLTIQPVHTWANNFVANKLAVHNGALYITGHTFEEDHAKQRGQLWAYNGSSIVPVYEVFDFMMNDASVVNYQLRGPNTYGKWLIFGHANDGVWFYDPETDAIHPGPKLKGVTADAGNYISAMTVWSNTIVAFNFNEQHFHHGYPTYREHVSSYLTTSEFDADLPGQDKNWTEVRIRFAEPLPASTSVTVQFATSTVVGEESGSPPWTTLGTINTASTEVGVLRIDGNVAINGGSGVRSKKLRLRLTLTPSTWAGGTTTNLTPEIAAIEVDYMMVDPPKWGWSFSAYAAEGIAMKRPGGSAYTLTGPQVESQLEALRRDPAKQICSYLDEDGTLYRVKVVSFNKNKDVPRDPVNEGTTFFLGLAEV